MAYPRLGNYKFTTIAYIVSLSTMFYIGKGGALTNEAYINCAWVYVKKT